MTSTDEYYQQYIAYAAVAYPYARVIYMYSRIHLTFLKNVRWSDTTSTTSRFTSIVIKETASRHFNQNRLPLPPSRMYTDTSVITGVSVIATQTGRVCQVRETDVSKCVWQQRWHFWDHTLLVPPSSLTNLHRIQTPTIPTPTFLTFTYTQVLWFLSSLTRPRTSGVPTTPTTRVTIISTRETQCMWDV